MAFKKLHARQESPRSALSKDHSLQSLTSYLYQMNGRWFNLKTQMLKNFSSSIGNLIKSASIKESIIFVFAHSVQIALARALYIARSTAWKHFEISKLNFAAKLISIARQRLLSAFLNEIGSHSVHLLFQAKGFYTWPFSIDLFNLSASYIVAMPGIVYWLCFNYIWRVMQLQFTSL